MIARLALGSRLARRSRRSRREVVARLAVIVGVIAALAIVAAAGAARSDGGGGAASPASPAAPGAAAAPPDAGAPTPDDDAAPPDASAPAAPTPAPAPPAADATPFEPLPRAVGYDHQLHDRDLDVAARPALPCASCHTLAASGALVGRPGHAACFGACHGPAPRAGGRGRVPAAQASLCVQCHAGAALIARARGGAALTVAYPPYLVARDFGLTMSHRRHAAAACTSCHTTGGAARPAAPHARCARCHSRGSDGAPPMTACATCHTSAYGLANQPRLAVGPLALSGFDHARHRGRAAAAACASCHAEVAATDGLDLPAPTTATCGAAGCHDGAAAFATTAACTRCHRAAPGVSFTPARPTAAFSHTAHAARLGDVACASCHGLDRRGEATAPDHAACTRCHADDFTRTAPRTCGACHIAAEPWRVLAADRPPPDETEFGARLSHAAHGGACTTCHALRAATRELRPPRGHAACAAGGCHAAATGPAPRLGDCAGCHALGLAPARTRQRLAAPWSVRARFRHGAHAAAAGATTCTACHDGVGAATTIDAVPAPAKATCAPCHDGAAAFKLTGTSCARCHGVARRGDARPRGGPR